jgi:peptide chain release factor subunit 3
MGTMVMGKVESGYCKLNQKCMLMPNKVKVEIVNVYCEDEETDLAVCGENVKVKIKGVEEDVN